MAEVITQFMDLRFVGKKRTKTCNKILNYCKTDIRDQVKNNKNTREYRVTSTKKVPQLAQI